MVDITPTPELGSATAPTKPALTVIPHILRFLGKRLREASTLRGAVLLISATFVYLSPDQQEAIVAVGLAVAGAIGVFFPDGEP
jgi:hypothetical protein